MLPSATEIVAFTGAVDSLVGVTHECDYPPGVADLPSLTASRFDPHALTSAEIDAAVNRVPEENLADAGSIYTLDADLLAELSPDLIVTQGLCEVCAVSTNLVETAASRLDSRPEVLSMNPTSLGDVLNETVRVGRALGREVETRRKVSALRDRLSRVEEAVEGLPRPRVACIEWLDPPFSAGHWVPEMVRLAGGEEVLASPGEPSARLSSEAVNVADPEVTVLMPCGFGVDRTVGEARALQDFPGRVWAVDANSYFSRPAPRLVDGVEILARLLHPEAFPDAPAPSSATFLSWENASL